MAHLRQAILLKPDYAEAYAYFSQEVRFRPGHPMIKVIEDQLAKGGASQVNRCYLHFTAAKAYDDIGDYDRAMAHFHKGNAAKNAKYDPEAQSEKSRRITASFTPGRFAALAGTGLADERMVFVVGMPRSGTTLVEQIIASHPRAHGAGELYFMESAIASLVVQIASEAAKSPEGGEKTSLQVPATRYLQDVMAHTANQDMPANTERIVDKMPANYHHLGWIRLMFPKAKIIHCRRDPRDTCLSCYFQNFKIRNDFAFDLPNLGFHYRHYQALMRHWRDILGIEMLEVDYERLVAEPEPAMREIIAYCGLPWDDACLEFHKTKRPVLTASFWQVRQPLYQGSTGRWRHYEQHLGPMLEALGEDGTKAV
jgi:tetratricopeptide (TPR) repeat protein